MEFNWKNIRKPLAVWYQQNYRKLRWRDTKNPYHIWISEIMLQQTRVEAVKAYYDRFMREIPDIEALSRISEDELLKLWEGLGYYNRARNLQRAAICIMEKHNGEFPMRYEEVLELPGIGEYTAGAICSICFGLPTPAVDGNVLRVVARLTDNHDNIDDIKTKKRVRENLLPLYREGDCGLLTQSLMELGAVICIPNGMPKCDSCPLQEMCVAYKRNSYGELPVRRAKKKRRIEEKTVFILHDGERYGIRKRDDSGLLANMWEFYHTDERLTAAEAVRFISEKGFEPVLIEKELPYTHIFSHVEWRMTAYYIVCRNKKSELTWVEKKEFDDKYALPTAFKIFLERES